MGRVKFKQIRALDEMMNSRELTTILEGLGSQVLSAAQRDSNPVYVASLDLHTFHSDRVSVQVGAAPGIGRAVEAKRGTLARALGAAGA